LVGFHREFDYERMRIASDAVRNGARLIATNDDATYPTPDGPIPGGGAIVAAVATAAGVEPTIAGKPYIPMAALVAERCGSRFGPSTAIMVGDRWSTDGLFAERLGCRFALVRSGVTPAAAPRPPGAAIDAGDLAGIADALLGRSFAG
jgi:4-nitrophenyl phosphatase